MGTAIDNSVVTHKKIGAKTLGIKYYWYQCTPNPPGSRTRCLAGTYPHHGSDFRSARTASMQSTATCFDSFRRPPTASSTSSLERTERAALSRPATSSVRAEPAAMEAVQPRALYLASATRPDSMRTARRRMSPQMGLETSTVTAGAGRSPTLRGLLKCSISSGLTACHCRVSREN